MVYCSNCGAPIAEEAYFCPKCGSKTLAGKAAKVAYPSDELKDIFYQVGNELEKAFTLAAKETHSALKKASENFQQRNAQPSQAAGEATVACPNCGAKNVSGAIFCHSCGKRLVAESSGTA